MQASSTALQKKKAAEPSARRTTKSPMSSLRKVCGPCTKSSNTTRSPRGTRKRSVGESLCRAPRALLGREVPAGAGVARRLARGELRTARELELQRRTEARISRALPFELREIAAVERAALRLPVGSPLVRTVRPRVPIDSEP